MFSFKLGGNKKLSECETKVASEEAKSVAALFQEAEDAEEEAEEALIRGRIAPLKVDIGLGGQDHCSHHLEDEECLDLSFKEKNLELSH